MSKPHQTHYTFFLQVINELKEKNNICRVIAVLTLVKILIEKHPCLINLITVYLLEFVNRNIKDTNDWKLLLNDQNNNFGSVLTLASIICLLIL